MNTPVTIDTQALKALIKESVREVLNEEWFRIWQMVIPEVSDAEQADIEKSLGSAPVYDLSQPVSATRMPFFRYSLSVTGSSSDSDTVTD